MNLFFSAAKQSICVDVVSMGDDVTGGILQQAADITGGMFLHAKKPHALLKILMTNMLTDPLYRIAFPQLSLNAVDYRASCVCHHQLVSSGWVCSVCLSVLCKYTPICKVCKAAFTIANLPKKPWRRKRAAADSRK
uniref:General transcription factor IIH subunit 3 n=1 Tax=Caenorhabditis japonica TaxID=281687 RepID=A0A8R1HZA8_CAEJA